MSAVFDEDRSMAALTTATRELALIPTVPIAQVTNPYFPSTMFVGNFFTWTPPFPIYITQVGLPDRTIIHTGFAAALWLALETVHTQFTITPQIKLACRELGIRSPPVFLTNPFHGGFNELNRFFSTEEEAMTAVADAQRDGVDAVSWVGEFVHACLELPNGLTGVETVDRQLVSYYKSIGWPGFTEGESANECRDLILHPTLSIRRAEEYDPVSPYFDRVTSETDDTTMADDSEDSDEDFILVGGDRCGNTYEYHGCGSRFPQA